MDNAALRHVLIVDDEALLQTLILDTLEGEYRLDSAYNGRDGLKKATELKPDVILMDMMMPDVSGPEAVKLLLENPATASIPVVVMSANDQGDAAVAKIRQEPNVAGFLMKPFRPSTIRGAITAALERAKPSA